VFDSWEGQEGIFLFATAFKPCLEPIQPPIQWEPGDLSPEVKLPGREADYLPQCNAEVKNAWSYTSTLLFIFTATCLVKHRDNFTFHHEYIGNFC